VEDQYLVAEEMRRMVERLGGRVMGPVATVAGAMALLRETRPDVALLDVDLHGAPIYQVADVLLDAGAPVIFTTGFDREDMPLGYRDLPHVDKPVTARSLASVLSEIQQEAWQ
jgi:DNA-binding NarL/FixJ family response regulator